MCKGGHFLRISRFSWSLKITQSNDKDWSETNSQYNAKQHGGFDLVTSHVQMVIVFCTKAAILSPIQVPWGKSRTFCKQQRLEMLHTSRRFSATRQGSRESKGIWVLPETIWQEMKVNCSLAFAFTIHWSHSQFFSLMSKTVNPNYQDELGYTPLHYAALNGHRYINILNEFIRWIKLKLYCRSLDDRPKSNEVTPYEF